MAGSDPNFDPDVFTTDIRNTMVMGMPTAVSEQLTWHFDRSKAFDNPDPAGLPYEWTADPVSDQPGNPDEPDGEVIVPYVIEFAAGSDTETRIGPLDRSRATVTLLEDDYDQIKDADYCSIEDTRYEIEFVAPPMGLFEVTVYQIYITARDES